MSVHLTKLSKYYALTSTWLSLNMQPFICFILDFSLFFSNSNKLGLMCAYLFYGFNIHIF